MHTHTSFFSCSYPTRGYCWTQGVVALMVVMVIAANMANLNTTLSIPTIPSHKANPRSSPPLNGHVTSHDSMWQDW